jgi:hypothetical protein
VTTNQAALLPVFQVHEGLAKVEPCSLASTAVSAWALVSSLHGLGRELAKAGEATVGTPASATSAASHNAQGVLVLRANV